MHFATLAHDCNAFEALLGAHPFSANLLRDLMVVGLTYLIAIKGFLPRMERSMCDAHGRAFTICRIQELEAERTAAVESDYDPDGLIYLVDGHPLVDDDGEMSRRVNEIYRDFTDGRGKMRFGVDPETGDRFIGPGAEPGRD